MDRISVCALGGLDECGRDCYVVEINDDLFVVDVGVKIPDKTMPGIDAILPNCSYIIQNKHRLKGYFITHGHDESMSALKYIYDKAPAPIFCSYTTSVALIGQSIIHHRDIRKLNPHFEIVNPNDSLNVAGHQIELFQTYHNIANSFGVCFKTDRGNIIFAIDFIIDFTKDWSQYQFCLDKLYHIAKEKTLLLMCESKTADVDGYCSPRHRSIDKLEKAFKSQKRIFVSTFWQNSYSVAEIIELAKRYKKKIYLYDDYTRTVVTPMLEADIGVTLSNDQFVSKEDFVRVRNQDLVILIVGQSFNLYREIAYIAEGINSDNRIRINENDIFISLAAYNTVMEIEATHCLDALYRTNCEIIWFTFKTVAFMHARQDDIRALITITKPQFYMPIRGTFSKMMANAKVAANMGVGLNHMSIFILDNGMRLLFEGDSSRPRIIPNNDGEIDVSSVLVDGIGTTLQSEKIIEERQKLAADGTVVIAATISKSQKAIIAGPDCQMRGFVFLKEAEPLLKSLSQIFVDEINDSIKKGDFVFDDAKRNILERSAKFIKRENGRDPLITPLIIVVD